MMRIRRMRILMVDGDIQMMMMMVMMIDGDDW